MKKPRFINTNVEVRRSLVIRFAAIKLRGPRFNPGQDRNLMSASCPPHAPPLGPQHRVPESAPSLELTISKWKVYRMGADTSVVKKKHAWNPMAGEEWMEKHWDREGEGGKAMDTKTGCSPRYLMLRLWEPVPTPKSLETHQVRKWGDIGHYRLWAQEYTKKLK